jgi:hypothetical protein
MKFGRFEIKRVENTVWDYVVPLSLMGLVLIPSLIKTNGNSVFFSLFYQIIIILILILASFFVTRFFRMLTFFISIVLTVFYYGIFVRVIEFFEIALPITILTTRLVWWFLFYSFAFSFGSLIVLLIYGNNIEIKITEVGNFTRTLIAFTAYGLYIDFFLYFYLALPFGLAIVDYVSRLNIWKFKFMYTLLFFFIGLAVGKYKRRRVTIAPAR